MPDPRKSSQYLAGRVFVHVLRVLYTKNMLFVHVLWFKMQFECFEDTLIICRHLGCFRVDGNATIHFPDGVLSCVECSRHTQFLLRFHSEFVTLHVELTRNMSQAVSMLIAAGSMCPPTSSMYIIRCMCSVGLMMHGFSACCPWHHLLCDDYFICLTVGAGGVFFVQKSGLFGAASSSSSGVSGVNRAVCMLHPDGGNLMNIVI